MRRTVRSQTPKPAPARKNVGERSGFVQVQRKFVALLWKLDKPPKKASNSLDDVGQRSRRCDNDAGVTRREDNPRAGCNIHLTFRVNHNDSENEPWNAHRRIRNAAAKSEWMDRVEQRNRACASLNCACVIWESHSEMVS
jgi:hypothetical protein